MADMRNPEFFETRSIPRLLVQFSTPAIIAAFVTATYNLVARVFVAQRFGTDGVAALTVSFPVIVIFLAIAMMIGTGATTIISIRLGERETDKAEETLGQALFLSCVTAAIFIGGTSMTVTGTWISIPEVVLLGRESTTNAWVMPAL